ncbi:MAG: helicase C-terminal domain-containing protein [Acidimicrobiales bacterium]
MPPFDFKKLARGGAISSITDPAALFDALPNKAEGYGYLRAVQKTILDAWSPRRNERDLVIKTNTGGGKTIAGLLILQASIHEGIAPALYLAPDPHLAKQVLGESAKLGLTTVDDPENTKFLSGEAICVTTMQVLINGKSRFGLVGAVGRQPLPVRTIVIDDAHAALALAEERTFLRIPSSHPAHAALVDMFDDDLRQQGLNALLDIREGDPTATPLRVPFWSWYDKREQVLQTLRPHRADGVFEWSWPLIADILPWCQATVGTETIEITPLCPPIEKLPSFAEADRRIYLTATLADDSVLVTHFGANAHSIAASIVPDSAADLGDRLIIAPQELNPAITHPQVRATARVLANEHNVVVLVPSYRQAGQWSTEADATVSTSADITAVVERLKAGHVGLVVIINRYDGIDLPDAACRVLIVDGLPQAYSLTERREAVALRDSDAMVTRQLQRLEQGMGRGVRGRDDRCAVILLGARLTQLVSRADVANRLSPATKAQLHLSRRVAHDLEGASMDDLEGVVRQVIDGDAGFREISRESLVGVTYGPALLAPTAVHLRQAYDAAVGGRLEQSCDDADRAVKAALESGDARLAGWLGETLATYLHPLDAVRAQQALATASQRNPAVLRPRSGLSYRRVNATDAQARLASSLLQERYPDGGQLRLGIDAVLADLVWDSERTDATEDALADLAQLLGLVSQRPERDFGRGSDVLWALSSTKYAVIEAKSGATGAMIWKKDINQLAGSVNWCKTEYGEDTTVLPVMMHPAHIVERSGTPPSGTRVLNGEKLEELKAAVLAYATALAQQDAFRDEGKVGEQLRAHRLLAGDIINAYSVAARRQT